MLRIRKILNNQYLPILAILAVSLVLGLLTLKDYGQSWDEPGIYKYGAYALHAYHYFLNPQSMPNFPGDFDYYGPAFFIIADLLSRFFMALIPSWSLVNAMHFVYFLTFLLAVLILYLFARRWMGIWAALGAALLLLTQPLLWGHAFMNPKDTPFMTFFLASIYIGFCMVDAPAGSLRRGILILLAGVILGLTVSIRVTGPLAGIFVILYALVKSRSRAFPFTIIYILIATIISYLTWPFLWKAPIANYFKSLQVMSQFPFTKDVLFWGQRYSAGDLPKYFFPTIFSLQLTEPVLLLFLFGLVILVFSLRRKDKLEATFLFLGWFLLPVIAIVVTGSTLYDNARQLFFLFPPVFLVAGLTMDLAFKYLTGSIPRIILFLILLLPALYPAIRLHPYEYIYYNSFVRGTGGAYRQFEMDYWGTSIQEGMDYINQVAPQGSSVFVFGPDLVVRQYARPDLHVLLPNSGILSQSQDTYAILLTRQNLDERNCQRAKVVFTVSRLGSTFSIVKKLEPGYNCR